MNNKIGCSKLQRLPSVISITHCHIVSHCLLRSLSPFVGAHVLLNLSENLPLRTLRRNLKNKKGLKNESNNYVFE